MQGLFCRKDAVQTCAKPLSHLECIRRPPACAKGAPLRVKGATLLLLLLPQLRRLHPAPLVDLALLALYLLLLHLLQGARTESSGASLLSSRGACQCEDQRQCCMRSLRAAFVVPG